MDIIYSVVRNGDPGDTEKPRNTRFDKTVSLKFPVSDLENAKFKRHYLLNKDSLNASSITNYLTMIFRYALKHHELINQNIVYKSSKIYKTIKINQVEKNMLSGAYGLTITWCSNSDRKTIHRMMISMLNYLDRGGQINVDEVQPIRPVKHL
ncbi:MAG: hypothetical protein AB7V16_11335 [Vulcanibacillus sp.]